MTAATSPTWQLAKSFTTNWDKDTGLHRNFVFAVVSFMIDPKVSMYSH